MNRPCPYPLTADNHTSDLWEDIQNNEYDPDSYEFSKEAELYLEDYESGHADGYVKNLVMAKPPVTCKPKPGEEGGSGGSGGAAEDGGWWR